MRRTFIAGATAALLVGCIMTPASAEEVVDPADVTVPAAEVEAPAEVTEPDAVVEPGAPAAPADAAEPEAPADAAAALPKIGRASCRERV